MSAVAGRGFPSNSEPLSIPTPNLGIAHIAASQNQKEVTANDAHSTVSTRR